MLEIFQLPFMKSALISSILIGLMCSYLGIFVVLRRIIFVGIALAQMSALGVAAAVYFDKDPTIFALLFTIIGVILFAPSYGGKKLPVEAFIGIGFAASWAVAILILSKAANGEADMLNLVRGNILGTTSADITLLITVFLAAAAIFTLFYKNFLFISFDSEMAKTLGVKSGFWNFLFYLILGIVVAVSIRVAGVLLTFSFLLIPAVTALNLEKGMKTSFICSLLFSIAASAAGLISSFYYDLPTGPAIVGASFLLLIITAAGKGVLGFILNSNQEASCEIPHKQSLQRDPDGVNRLETSSAYNTK